VKKLAWFFRESFTDARGRPEIKMILGVPILIAAVVYGFKTGDWKSGFLALSGLGVTLVGGTAIADGFNDSRGGSGDAHI
jgi:hypothetical protein